MRTIRFLAAVFACAFLPVRAAAAQDRPLVLRMVGMGTIDGIVTDTMLVPLSGATVSILGSSIRVVTGDNGRFRISALESGQVIVIAQRLGYEPLSARVNVGIDTERVSFALERVVTALDTVRVAGAKSGLARHRDFEDRLARHDATAAFTEADIDKVNPVDSWQMLSRVPALKFIPVGKNGGLIAVSTRAMRIEGNPPQAVPCYMDVMVDGIMMMGDRDGHFDMSHLPAPKEIHGMEVFAGPATIPPQYNGAGNSKMCGLIAVWTR